MKIAKGKLKLSSSDTKIGEFVITNEAEHVKIQATSGFWSMRYHQSTPFARFIETGLQNKQTEALHNIISVLYYATTLVPDVEYLKQVQNSCIDYYERNKEMLGVPAVSDAEDKVILQALKDEYLAAEALHEENDA